MDYKKMKTQAKKNLAGNYTTLLLAMLIMVSIGAVCYFIGFILHSTFLSVALTLIADSLLIMGFIKMVVKVSKKKKAELNDLTSETDLFFPYIGVTLVSGAILGVLYLLAAIAFKSLVTVWGNLAAINTVLGVLLIILGVLLTTVIIAALIYIAIAFSQANFVLFEEKKLSPTKVLSKSFEMMDGYVLEYLILTITFVGWFILCELTLGIGYIFLAPYLMVVYANFYKIVKKEYKTAGNKKVDKIFNDKDLKEEE